MHEEGWLTSRLDRKSKSPPAGGGEDWAVVVVVVAIAGLGLLGPDRVDDMATASWASIYSVHTHPRYRCPLRSAVLPPEALTAGSTATAQPVPYSPGVS
jgi:hypothetical protein